MTQEVKQLAWRAGCIVRHSFRSGAVMRSLILISLVCLSCATASRSGKTDAELIRAQIETAQAVLNNPAASADERTAARVALANAAKRADALGAAYDSEYARAEANENKAAKYNALLCGGGAVGAALIAAGLFLYRFARR